MLIRVLYTGDKIMSVAQFERALTCRRCEGTGEERFSPGFQCPNCEGTGDSRDNGWTYVAPDEWRLKVGDRVVVPPTPRSEGKEQVATVIGLDSTFKLKSKLKEAVRRV